MIRPSGITYAVLAFTAWGFIPLFWKVLVDVSAFTILCHRMLWSAVALGFVLMGTGRFRTAISHLRVSKTRRRLVISSIFIGSNWFVFVWAVNTGRALDASLGYFIAPLLNVLLGRIALGERLRFHQAIAISVVALGVGFLTMRTELFPWTALFLALSFSSYGLLRKTASIGSLEGLFIECLFLSIPALGYLIWEESVSAGFSTLQTQLKILLVFAGPLTVIPLYLYTKGARRVQLTTLGLLQYISPSLQFLVAVFLLDEIMDGDRLHAFMVIWLGLALFSGPTFFRSRQIQSER